MSDRGSLGTYPVHFGGELRELWTGDGLKVSYTGRVCVLAVREGEGFRAVSPPHSHYKDVKTAYNEAARAAELAARLNFGAVPPLTAAYFAASAEAYEALSGESLGAELFPVERVLSGGEGAVILLELLRIMLDERRMSWEDATSRIARAFTLIPGADACRVPIAALGALQPRDAGLVRALNEKLCERLWELWPGDWLRIGAASILRDGEADLLTLCAVLCGRIKCTKEERAGVLRALYTAMPAKFELS